MEQDFKKLVLGDCEVTDAGCQVIADIANTIVGIVFVQEHEVFQEVQDHD